VFEKFSKNAEIREFAKWNRKAGNYFNHFFTKNEIFFKSIAEGKLEVNSSGIEHLEANEVVFNDGNRLEIDELMLNTGYVDQFPFLKDVEISDVRKMYKHMIHPDLGTDIVLIGWARPGVGGVPACSEMQSRYVALLCSNKLQLPDNHQLQALIEKQANFEQQMYHKNPTLKTLVHYSSYMHDFAKIIGCSPWRMATFLNPKLLYKVWYGSQLPNIYRLYGSYNSPEQAKEIIYKMPIAINPVEQVMLSFFTVVSTILARLGVISADPSY
jgi:dimethylaniline monooxygenase (N-oxide forming)